MCLGTCRTSVSHWKSSAFSSGAFHLHHSPKIPTSRLVLFLSLHFFFSFPENVRLNFRLHVKQLERNHDKSLGNHWAFLPIILLDSLQLLSSLNTALSYLMLVAWRKRGRDKRRGKKRKNDWWEKSQIFLIFANNIRTDTDCCFVVPCAITAMLCYRSSCNEALNQALHTLQ